MKTTKLENQIKQALVNYGAMGENWRMKVTNREIIGRSDWAKVVVEITAPKKRKPCTKWELAINIARNQIHWDKSTFCNC